MKHQFINLFREMEEGSGGLPMNEALIQSGNQQYVRPSIEVLEDTMKQLIETTSISQYWINRCLAAEKVIELCVSKGSLASAEQKAAFEHLTDMQKAKIK